MTIYDSITRYRFDGFITLKIEEITGMRARNHQPRPAFSQYGSVCIMTDHISRNIEQHNN